METLKKKYKRRQEICNSCINNLRLQKITTLSLSILESDGGDQAQRLFDPFNDPTMMESWGGRNTYRSSRWKLNEFSV